MTHDDVFPSLLRRVIAQLSRAGKQAGSVFFKWNDDYVFFYAAARASVTTDLRVYVVFIHVM